MNIDFVRSLSICLLSFCLAISVHSSSNAKMSEDEQNYVEANMLGILYHELGHAVIDIRQVPIFGQEEDAADVFSVLLIDQLHDEQDAQDIAIDAAFGYIEDPDGEDEILYWDTHGPDEQRFFNHVCLFIGANPDERQKLVKQLELPKERAENCPDEFDLANESWGKVLDELAMGAPAKTITFQKGKSKHAEHFKLLSDLISYEVEQLNKEFAFPSPLTITIEDCGEPDAFYDLETENITLCVEFADYLIKRMPK